MPSGVPGQVWHAHLGGELDTPHIIVLAAVAIVANAALLAPRFFGLFVKRPLRRALEEVAGPDARLGRIALPLRGSLSVGGVELPGLPTISRVEAEVDLLGLRRDPVTIPRIVLTRASVPCGSPEAGAEGRREIDGPSNPESTVGEHPSPHRRDDRASSDHRRYEVGAIVIRSGGSDETESQGPGHPREGPGITLDGPGYPMDLDGLVRLLVHQMRADPLDPTSAPGAEAGPR